MAGEEHVASRRGFLRGLAALAVVPAVAKVVALLPAPIARLTLFPNEEVALGTSSQMWSDLYLASGSRIEWRDGGEVVLTHSAEEMTWNDPVDPQTSPLDGPA